MFNIVLPVGSKEYSIRSMRNISIYSRKGFTLVELLIVIVVIAILSTITVVAYNGIQVRARDSRRAQDISSIRKALMLYNIEKGGVWSADAGNWRAEGWELSSSPDWLSFLREDYGNMPVDPVNTGLDDPSNYELTYFYYCYGPNDGWSNYATPTAVIGYYSESSKEAVKEEIVVGDCFE